MSVEESSQIEQAKVLLASTPIWRLSLEEMSPANTNLWIWRRDDFAFGSQFTIEERPSLSFTLDYELTGQEIKGIMEKSTYRITLDSGTLQLEIMKQNAESRLFHLVMLQPDQIRLLRIQAPHAVDILRNILTSTPVWLLSKEEMSPETPDVLIWRRDDFAFGSEFIKEERPSMSFTMDTQLTVLDVSGISGKGIYNVLQQNPSEPIQIDTMVENQAVRTFNVVSMQTDRIVLQGL